MRVNKNHSKLFASAKVQFFVAFIFRVTGVVGLQMLKVSSTLAFKVVGRCWCIIYRA